MPSLKPFFSHSLTTIVFDVDSAVIKDCESERVCSLLENNCSTDIKGDSGSIYSTQGRGGRGGQPRLTKLFRGKI